MTIHFAIIALLTIASSIAAMTLRNVVHCALMLTLAFAGFAALYLNLGAQFVGFAQILIYIGAVAILIVFAILLTPGSGPSRESHFSSTGLISLTVALAVFGVLSGAVLSSGALAGKVPAPAEVTVRQIGDKLMTRYVLPLEVVGLLLTAALIGAVIIAMREKEAT